MSDATIQLNVEGTGPKIRTQKVTDPTAVSSAGAAQADTVTHQQVVTLADRHGGLGDNSAEILTELRAIHTALDIIAMRLA